MRPLIAALLVLAGCAARRAPTLSVPAPQPGRLSMVARAGPAIAAVRPIAVAVTNGRAEPFQLDARQIYAHGEREERVAPLPPAEAARRADGRRLPGPVKAGAAGAITGGALGAVSGAITGAIRGGIGAAVAAGSAAGAALGAITGVLWGRRDEPDVAGFEARALQSGSLVPGASATGYVYYPAGTYRSLEILVADERAGAPHFERLEVEQAE